MKEHLMQELKTAMKSKAAVRVDVIRALQAQIKDYEIANQSDVTDQIVLAMIQKQIKQRQDAEKIYRDNKRADLADKEALEATELATFLPAQLSDAELEGLINEAVNAVNATSAKDMGKVMNELKPKVTGRADPARLAPLVKARLS